MWNDLLKATQTNWSKNKRKAKTNKQTNKQKYKQKYKQTNTHMATNNPYSQKSLKYTCHGKESNWPQKAKMKHGDHYGDRTSKF